MAYRITVSIIDPGDRKIHVEHLFYGATESDALTAKRHHLQSCSYFRDAERDGFTDEEIEEIADRDWPQPTPVSDVIDMEEEG